MVAVTHFDGFLETSYFDVQCCSFLFGLITLVLGLGQIQPQDVALFTDLKKTNEEIKILMISNKSIKIHVHFFFQYTFTKIGPTHLTGLVNIRGHQFYKLQRMQIFANNRTTKKLFLTLMKIQFHGLTIKSTKYWYPMKMKPRTVSFY